MLIATSPTHHPPACSYKFGKFFYLAGLPENTSVSIGQNWNHPVPQTCFFYFPDDGTCHLPKLKKLSWMHRQDPIIYCNFYWFYVFKIREWLLLLLLLSSFLIYLPLKGPGQQPLVLGFPRSEVWVLWRKCPSRQWGREEDQQEHDFRLSPSLSQTLLTGLAWLRKGAALPLPHICQWLSRAPQNRKWHSSNSLKVLNTETVKEHWQNLLCS